MHVHQVLALLHHLVIVADLAAFLLDADRTNERRIGDRLFLHLVDQAQGHRVG